MSKCIHALVTTHQQSCGKVMYSVMSVCQSFCPPGLGEVPCGHYPWHIGPHYKGTPWTCDLTVKGLPGPWPQPPPLGAKTGDQFKLVHLRIPPTSADIWWLLHKHLQYAGMFSLFDKKNRTSLHLVAETSRLSTPIIYYYIFNRYLKSYIKEEQIFNWKKKIITFDTKFNL